MEIRMLHNCPTHGAEECGNQRSEVVVHYCVVFGLMHHKEHWIEQVDPEPNKLLLYKMTKS